MATAPHEQHATGGSIVSTFTSLLTKRRSSYKLVPLAHAIPAVWREQVEGAARLRELADALLLLATGEGPSAVGGP
jgi:hypothetical protein